MTNPLPVLLLLALVPFAGCLGGSEPTTDPSSSTQTTGTEATGPGGTNSTEPAPVNEAPTVVLGASALNGTTPANITFYVNGTDPEGEALAWALDADGDGEADANGTSVPANATILFEAAGTFNATVTVSDGTHNVTANLAVVIEAGVPPVVLTGSTTVPGNPAMQDVGPQSCVGFLAEESGRDCVFWTLPASYAGRAFVATSSHSSGDLVFSSECDPVESEVVAEFFGTMSGKIPAGAGCAVMWVFGAGTGNMRIEIS